jgi:ParB family chromosome partitioning protein
VLDELTAAVEADGAAVIGRYRDPLGGHGLLLVALPVELVAPTPYQRAVSDAHLRRLADVMERVGLFLDPIVVTREGDRKYWTPNGSHRLAAMRKLGARAITALLVPDRAIATKILALNTEKAHNLKEKALEVIGMARALAGETDRREDELALEFEDPVLLTLGPCYERNARFSGGAYRPALVRVEAFLERDLAKAIAVREARAESLLALDERVGEIVAKLKERGLQSPYLRTFVTARLNPYRFKKDVTATPEELIEKMRAAAAKFDVGKVRADQLTATGGYGGEDE